MTKKNIYYSLKPIIPRFIQIFFRQKRANNILKKCSDNWPIEKISSNSKKNWPGWPENKKFCFSISHDVENIRGLNKCLKLAKIEKELGFRSCFSFVPERYELPYDIKHDLLTNGFEIAVHGLKHDGKLYRSRKEFDKRAQKINEYIKAWEVTGFYSPAMEHNMDWLHTLNIEYDASTFDIDPFEPQPEGVDTIYPFWVQNEHSESGYVEIPYTLPQDITLFIILKKKNNAIWENKLSWLAENKALAFIKTHPDYMYFGHGRKKVDEYPVDYYINFLKHIKENYRDEYWHALPKEISKYCKKLNINTSK